MKKEFDFAKEFGSIDELFVEHAGKPWKKKKYSVFQLYSRKIACLALAAILSIAVAGNERVQAAVREFTTKIGEALGFTQDLSSYTEILDQTQTKNGISMTLKEVIMDDRILIVSVHVNTGQKEEDTSVWVDEGKTRINGQKRLAHESMQADGGDSDSFQDKILAQVYEDAYLPEGDIKVHLVLNAQRQGEMDLELVQEAPLDEPVQGEAEFVYDFVVTSEELRAKTVKQELDTVIGEPGKGNKNLTLKELTMNDLYGRIAAAGVTWEDEWVNQYDLKLKGTDSFGNPVSFEGVTFVTEDELLFTTSLDGDYESGEVIDLDNFRLSIPDKDCEYLDLQLYERKIIWETQEDPADESVAVEEDGESDAQEVDGTMDEDEDCTEQEMAEAYEAYEKEENYGWEPVGEPFRINIQR